MPLVVGSRAKCNYFRLVTLCIEYQSKTLSVERAIGDAWDGVTRSRREKETTPHQRVTDLEHLSRDLHSHCRQLKIARNSIHVVHLLIETFTRLWAEALMSKVSGL